MRVRVTILALALWTATLPFPAQYLNGVKSIVANGNTNFAVLSDGTAWWWGEESSWNEALGGGQSTPLQFSGLTGVVAIAPPLALKADGTVWSFCSEPLCACAPGA